MYKKIDLFIKNSRGGWTYVCTTQQSRTCKEAKEKFLSVNKKLDTKQVKACFQYYNSKIHTNK
jgi:hypothetical protein